jgi:hypothetical protein
VRPSGEADRRKRVKENILLFFFQGASVGLPVFSGRRDKLVGGEDVRVGDVADVGPIKEVLVITDLEMCLVALVDLAYPVHDLTVPRPRT